MKRSGITAGRTAAPVAGFTLVEMLLVIGLLTLISATTFPALMNWMEQNQLNQSAESFILTLSRASAEAANEGIPHAIEFLPDGQKFRTLRMDSSVNKDVDVWEVLSGDCVFQLSSQDQRPLSRGDATNSCRLWFYADGRCTSSSLEIRSGKRVRIVDLEGSTGQALIRQASR